MVTPGRAAPAASFTTPSTAPVVVCAMPRALEAITSAAANTTTSRTRVRIVASEAEMLAERDDAAVARS
jgi:hypothetical protein